MRVSRISLIIKTVSSSSEDASTAKKKASNWSYMQSTLLLLTAIAHTVQYRTPMEFYVLLQRNLSIKDTQNKGHLSNKNTVCSPNHIELCTNPLN